MPRMPDLRNLETYPVLTREVGPDGLGDGPRAGGGASLTRQVQASIRQVLGWRYRTGDSKGFTAALNAAAVRHIDGEDGTVRWEWRPAAFMVQADLGEVTGAQASLMQRTRAAIDQAKPILARLGAIRPDANDEGIEGMRSLIESHLESLAEEIAQVGGPKAPRVDGIFWILLGGSTRPQPDGRDKTYYRSLLGQFETRLGYVEDRVNNIDQERGLTDLLVLRDIVLSLHASWLRFRDRYLSGEGFLGTSLVRLSRLLDVIVESVGEVTAAMDSVFFGEAERQAYLLHIDLPGNRDTRRLFGRKPVERRFRLTVADLLGWIAGYAAMEARQHIQAAGKDGVVPVTFTLARMYHIVLALRGEDDGVEAGDVVEVPTAAAAGDASRSGLRTNLASDAAIEETAIVDDDDDDQDDDADDDEDDDDTDGTMVDGDVDADADDQACVKCHGLTHPRVQRALCELACYLRTAAGIGIKRYIAEPVVGREAFYLNYLDEEPTAEELLTLDRVEHAITEEAGRLAKSVKPASGFTASEKAAYLKHFDPNAIPKLVTLRGAVAKLDPSRLQLVRGSPLAAPVGQTAVPRKQSEVPTDPNPPPIDQPIKPDQASQQPPRRPVVTGTHAGSVPAGRGKRPAPDKSK